jgi:hypothetical protein
LAAFLVDAIHTKEYRMNITHGFSCGIADDAAAVAAGSVLPSHWNANHTLSATTTNITTDTVLTSADIGKILNCSGTDLDITLPSAAAVSAGWFITIYNDNSTNVYTPHASASANTPYGARHIRIIRAGSDTLNGVGTDLHGATTFVGPREAIDIWRTSTGTFAARPSSVVGWKDLVADPHTHGTNLKDPAESAISAGFFRGLEFSNESAGNEKEVYCSFHIGHDYMMGTRVYPHVHWTPGNTTSVDAVRWGFQYSVAKGHSQQAWFTEGGGSTTVYVTQTLSGTAYMHHVAEVSDADAIPTTNLEPDSVILMRIFRDSANAADTLGASVWMTTVDMHYLADRASTPKKAPGFFL